MKIDHEYLKKILVTFESSPQADTHIEEMTNAGFLPESEKFIFHIRLLGDSDLIARVDGKKEKSFLFKGFGPMGPLLLTAPMRLTAKGHEFKANLQQKEVWNVVKTNFKDASISEVVDIAKQIAQALLKKKIKSIIGIDID